MPTDLSQAIKDSNGDVSSKRTVAFISLGFFLAFALADTVSHKGVPSEYIMNDLMMMIVGGLALSVTEWFAPKRG